MAFEPYLQNLPQRFEPRLLEEQWPEILKAKNLFPLRAILKLENGGERLRFEVKTIVSEKIEDKNGSLFQPSPDYKEIQLIPF